MSVKLLPTREKVTYFFLLCFVTDFISRLSLVKCVPIGFLLSWILICQELCATLDGNAAGKGLIPSLP